MKSSTLKTLCISGILVAAGLIIMVLALVFSGGIDKLLNAPEYKETAYDITENFDGIYIDTTSENIIILPSDEDQVKVITHETDKIKFAVEITNNTLNIIKNDTRSFFEKIEFNTNSNDITVYLPKKQYDTLEILCISGDVHIAEFSFSSLNIKQLSGDTELSALTVSGNITLSNTSGDIHISSCSANAINSKNVSGETQIYEFDCNQDMMLTSTSGDIILNNCSADGNISIKNTSGDISLTESAGKCNADMNVISGDIALNKFDASSLEMKTTSGDIKGSILSDKIFSASSNSGDIKIPPSVKDSGTCKCSSISGDIIIEIAE